MRYEKDGFDPIETSLPAEGVRLRAEGWSPAPTEAPALTEAPPSFDGGGYLPPGANTVVNDLGRPEVLVRETPTETPDDPDAETPKRRRSK